MRPSPRILGINQRLVLRAWTARRCAELSVYQVAANARRRLATGRNANKEKVGKFTDALVRNTIENMTRAPKGHHPLLKSVGFKEGHERYTLTFEGTDKLIEWGCL